MTYSAEWTTVWLPATVVQDTPDGVVVQPLGTETQLEMLASCVYVPTDKMITLVEHEEKVHAA